MCAVLVSTLDFCLILEERYTGWNGAVFVMGCVEIVAMDIKKMLIANCAWRSKKVGKNRWIL